MARFVGKNNDGFEIGWQMVPVNGQKEIELIAGSGLTVMDGGAHLKIIELKETTLGGPRASNRKFVIKGLKKGKTAIWAKDRSRISAQMIAQVIPQRIVTITFNFVSDRGEKHYTKRDPKIADDLIQKLNNIYLPQANVKFQKIASRKLKIDADLGEVVVRDKKTPSNDKFSLLVDSRDPNAQINVFFVWKCQTAGMSHDTDGVAEIAVSRDEKTNCMVEDDLGASFERVVAHEVGHNLGLKDDFSASDLLMYGQTAKSLGTRLRKQEIDRIGVM